MTTAAIAFYDVVLTIHILAVVIAFGITFAYPLLDAFVRRTNATDLVVLHRLQVFLTARMITPAMVVVLAAGLYLALDRWNLGDPWISATFAILIVLFALAGAAFAPLERRCLQLAERDLREGAGRSAEYEQVAHRLAMFGALAGLLVVAAIFLMTAKPGL